MKKTSREAKNKERKRLNMKALKTTNTVFPHLSTGFQVSAGSKEDIMITNAPKNESQMSTGAQKLWN